MKKIAIVLLTVFALWSCTNDGPSGPSADDFDREAILINWADNIIIPSFTAFSGSTDQLQSDASAFAEAPTLQNLETLRNSWQSDYLAFQHVSMFEMGKAMELRFRDNLNIYPTDANEIESNIMEGNYNLELPSLNNSQGFPALDYMLNGLGENDTEVFPPTKTQTGTYLTDLTYSIPFK